MRPDVSSLKLFYNRPIGRGVAACLSQKISTHWSSISSLDVMGIGYPLPVMDNLLASGADLFALMPGGQGAAVWPDEKHGRSILIDEYHLPFEDGSIDRIFLMHAIEYAHQPAAFLRECWRVLKPGGRLLVLVPNRRRAWSALEHTPFGQGTPYSSRQMQKQLEDQLLYPVHVSSALMMPPFMLPGIEKMMKVSELALRGSFEMLGGLLFIEAEKRVYSRLTPPPKRQGVRVLSGVSPRV
ncbi:methyltransferase domain-containing protein [Temperatibacter marinus]|uniref:Methyltransferase domain-containing protein n=1 Tax=Temperatibacter marinus TaxID=1456591 RepID=A0AA52EAZ0_9PROT|nr:methyltransferase domain-containing protein [Temperatibacter marinus]WND01410.1 methyltransferase domain-containing protein [Temperatibacter marinus]